MINISAMKMELMDFSERIDRDFDFGDDQSSTWFAFLLKLLGF